MNRRSVLGAAIGGASLVMAMDKVFAEEHQHEHTAHASLSEAARHCVSSGDACMSHCLQLFAQGDTTTAACAKSVYQMSAICEALARLASAIFRTLGRVREDRSRDLPRLRKGLQKA